MMAEPLMGASAERPASTEALVAHWRAAEEPDETVDVALEAIQPD
jgi:hypothetical protein